jgi:hypothetical protein
MGPGDGEFWRLISIDAGSVVYSWYTNGDEYQFMEGSLDWVGVSGTPAGATDGDGVAGRE